MKQHAEQEIFWSEQSIDDAFLETAQYFLCYGTIKGILFIWMLVLQ